MSGDLPAGHEVRVFEDASFASRAAALVVSELGRTGGFPRLVLAGGRTPVDVYERLASRTGETPFEWRRVRFAFGDERMVPPDDDSSNYGMALRTLLAPLGVAADQVLRIRGEDPAGKAAGKVHKVLVTWGQRAPLFDVVLLGVGEDGHVASLFPNESWPEFGNRLAVSTVHPGGGERVSLTPAALQSTRTTLFLVRGENKAAAVASALGAELPSPRVPARMAVSASGRALWLLDAASASRLPPAVRASGETVSETDP